MAMGDFSKGFFTGAGVLVALIVAGLISGLIRGR